jgi:hypothetical protein
MLNVSAWEDDPKSDPAAKPIIRPVPALKLRRLGVALVGETPPPARYRRTTTAFRFWNAADSLTRAARYWAALAPEKTRWHTGDVLPALLDAGNDLNAYYDRSGLCFFHAHVAGEVVYSGESPDVRCSTPSCRPCGMRRRSKQPHCTNHSATSAPCCLRLNWNRSELP